MIARLVHPGSERATGIWTEHASGAGELIGAQVKRLSHNALYRVSDRLYENKEQIEGLLREKESGPKVLDIDPWRSRGRSAGQEGSRGRCGTSSRLPDALRRFARATGTAASQGFRTASPAARGAPHRHATRPLPNALGSRLYESLSALLGITGAGQAGKAGS